MFDAADDYLETSCPGAADDRAAKEADAAYVVGCTYTVAPAFKPKPPHGPDMKFPGWNAATQGACRSTCGPGGPPTYAATCDTEKQLRPGTKWCKDCGANPAGRDHYVENTAGQSGPAQAADCPRLRLACFLRRHDAA